MWHAVDIGLKEVFFTMPLFSFSKTWYRIQMQIISSLSDSKAERVFTVELDASDLATPYERALQHAVENTELKGFRKGKAPANTVEERLGKAAIFERVIGDILDHAVRSSLEKHGVEGLLGRPRVTITKMIPAESFACTIEFATAPEVKLGDIAAITTRPEEIEVLEAEVEELVDELRQRAAKETERAAGDAVQTGDRVIVDFSILKDHVAIEGGSAHGYSFITGRGAMVPDFERNIIGRPVGETFSFHFSYPEEYFEKSLAGTSADATVTVKQAFDRTVPAIEDTSWISDFGDVDSLEALKKRLRASVEADKRRSTDRSFERAMLDEFAAASTVEPISEWLLQQEAERMMEELEEDLTRHGLGMSQYLAQLGKTEQQVLEGFKGAARRRIAVGMVLEALADRENISPDAAEVDHVLAEMHKHHNHDHNHDHDHAAEHAAVARQLRSQKAIDWLKEKIGALKK